MTKYLDPATTLGCCKTGNKLTSEADFQRQRALRFLEKDIMQILAIIIASWQVSGTYISFSFIIQMRPTIPGMWNQLSLCLMGTKNQNAGAARGCREITEFTFTTGTTFSTMPYLKHPPAAATSCKVLNPLLFTYSSAMCVAERAAFSSLTGE